jgi:hypothetical protein
MNSIHRGPVLSSERGALPFCAGDLVPAMSFVFVALLQAALRNISYRHSFFPVQG